jgi:hypothetical protein
MDNFTSERIHAILHSCIDRTFSRTSKAIAHRPFHDALLSEEVVKASAFERSFSTSFGQGPIEEISQIVAEAAGFNAVRQHETMVNIYKGAQDEIERIMNGLRDGNSKPNWDQEVKRIVAFNKGDTIVTRVISDLWLQRDGHTTHISIKTVKPNLDQTQIAKRDMLLLKAHDPSCQAYFGLYYNPGGELRQDYDWGIPFKLFDMHRDPCVLIGRDYWDFLGGAGTYDSLLEIFASVGEITRQRLLGS